MLADRFESFALILRMNDPDRRADFKEAMAHVYFDVAGFSEPKQLADLLLDVPESHLLYGSDTPYTPIEACLGQARALEETDKLTDVQKMALFTGNALAVNPRLASIPAFAQAVHEPVAAAGDEGAGVIHVHTQSAEEAGGATQSGRRHWTARLWRRLFPKRHVTMPVPVPPKDAHRAVARTIAEEKALRFDLDPADDPRLADRYVVHLASPVGEVVIPVIVVFDDADRTTFHGKAKVMGLVAAYRDGRCKSRGVGAGDVNETEEMRDMTGTGAGVSGAGDVGVPARDEVTSVASATDVTSVADVTSATEAEYVFDIRVRLPFGPLAVHLDVTVDERSGSVRGIATAPHRKPMTLTGQRIGASA